MSKQRCAGACYSGLRVSGRRLLRQSFRKAAGPCRLAEPVVGNWAQAKGSSGSLSVVSMRRCIDHAGRNSIETDMFPGVFVRETWGDGVDATLRDHRSGRRRTSNPPSMRGALPDRREGSTKASSRAVRTDLDTHPKKIDKSFADFNNVLDTIGRTILASGSSRNRSRGWLGVGRSSIA